MRTCLALAWIVAAVAGCDPSSTTHTRACTRSADCPAPQMCVDGTCRAVPDGGPVDAGGGGMDTGAPNDARVRTLTGMHVEPAAPVLTAIDGAMPTIDFTLVGEYDDGSTSEITAGIWSADARVIGSIDRTTGLFTALGVVGGTSNVSVTAGGMTAGTTVTVQIQRTVLDTGAPSDAATHFAPGVTMVDEPARAASMLYPLDRTVFPGNVYPADLQWSGGAAGDLYQVRLDAPGVQVRAYVTHSGAAFGFHWLPTPEAWRALAESAPESDVTIAVDRWESATDTVIRGHGPTVRFAAATIRGAIYYWDLGQGRIQRINGDGTGRVSFMPNPPARPGDGRQCVACHAISRDGRRMAAEIWDGGGTSAIFDLTGDTTLSPPPMIVPPNVVSFLTASFSPDASRLVASFGNELFLVDGNSGARIASSLPSAGAAHPAWSPDGTQIAFITSTNGGWAVDFTRGDLAIVDAMAGDAFGTPRTILAAGSPPVIARPSWSPDSAYIAFQHSQHSRAYEDLGTGTHIFRPGSVEMVARDGATSYGLANLNGASPSSYYPTFSPFDEGGYFWLAFFSTRDYGNAQVGTAGAGRRQLWVAAIDSTPSAGIDPSSSPYWLPQQDVHDENMAAFWTEEACHMDGLGCAVSGECCSGFCRDTGAGPVCVPPDIVTCSHEGEACTDSGDCCPGEDTMCIGSRCTRLM